MLQQIAGLIAERYAHEAQTQPAIDALMLHVFPAFTGLRAADYDQPYVQILNSLASLARTPEQRKALLATLQESLRAEMVEEIHEEGRIF